MDVTCLCLTHGRPWLLAEAVESFRRQRLGSVTAELLVLNDCPEQRLFCYVPNVRIINGVTPYTDLSTKFNDGIREASGRYVMFWDDDDISLPDRIAESMARIGDAYAYRPTLCWSWHCGEITHLGEPLLCAGMVRRDAVLDFATCTPGEYNDRSMWDKLWPTRNVVQHTPTPQEVQYIYRWGGIGWHESGSPEQDSAVRAAQFRKAALADQRFKEGDINVRPIWRQYYLGLVVMAIQRGKARKR